jgi:hypothetical protein
MKTQLILMFLIALAASSCAPNIPINPQGQMEAVATNQTIPDLAESSTAAPAQTAATDCAGEDIWKMSQLIAEDYPFTSAYEIMSWFCNGAEFEDIMVALETEDLTDVPAEEMLEMLVEGLSWDEIWQVVGLTD